MLQGQCLCQAIHYQLSSELLFLYHCHCKECRAYSGASFATNATIAIKDLHIVDPEHRLAHYKTANGKRYFCNRCGSPIYSALNVSPEFAALHCGSLSGYPEKTLDAHLHTSEKCSWTQLDTKVQSFPHAPK